MVRVVSGDWGFSVAGEDWSPAWALAIDSAAWIDEKGCIRGRVGGFALRRSERCRVEKCRELVATRASNVMGIDTVFYPIANLTFVSCALT
jgi:hypothetical protein